MLHKRTTFHIKCPVKWRLFTPKTPIKVDFTSKCLIKWRLFTPIFQFNRNYSVADRHRPSHDVANNNGVIQNAKTDDPTGCVISKNRARTYCMCRVKQLRPTYMYTHTRQKNCHSGSLVLSCDTVTRVWVSAADLLYWNYPTRRFSK